VAAHRRGRVIVIDSPGTYFGLLEPDTSFTLCYAHVYTDGKNDARLTVYEGQEPQPQRLIFDSGVIPGDDWQCDWGRGRSEESVPDSNVGCSAILSGEGARAIIWRL
jgi:hypothetical protein